MQPPDQRPDISRLTPLIVGAAATIVAIILLWVVLSVRRDQPFPIDVWWNDLMLANRTEPGLVLAWIPGHLGGPVLAAVTAVVIVGTLLILRWWWAAITVAATAVVCIAIAAPLARLVARIRPEQSLAETVPTAFPSGHVAFATALVTVLGAAVPALALVAPRRGVGHLDDVESDVPVGALADGCHRRTVPGGRGGRAGVGQRRDDPSPARRTGSGLVRAARPADRPRRLVEDSANVRPRWNHESMPESPEVHELAAYPDGARRGPRGARASTSCCRRRSRPGIRLPPTWSAGGSPRCRRSAR